MHLENILHNQTDLVNLTKLYCIALGFGKSAQNCLEKVTHKDNLISVRGTVMEFRTFFPICIVQAHKTGTMSDRGGG